MLYETTPRQKESYLRFFEAYEEDEGEVYVEPKDAIIKKVPAEGGSPTWEARNGRGRRTLRITNKQKQEYFCNLSNAFLNFDSLLPSNIEIGLRIYLTSYEKYFTTSSKKPHRPTFKIIDAKLLVEFILLKPNLLRAMESRLAKSFLQINFLAKFVKSYSLEQGILERRISISTRDPVSNILLFIQPNTVRYVLHILSFGNRNSRLPTYPFFFFSFNRHTVENIPRTFTDSNVGGWCTPTYPAASQL